MADVTDPFRAAARLAKTAALKTEVVSAWWGTVASVSGDDISVVLDGDDLLQVQPVTVNAAGPCVVGDEVLLQMQGRDLTIVANPTAQARLGSDTGWVTSGVVSPSAGVSVNSCRFRRIGPWVSCDIYLTATVAYTLGPTGDISNSVYNAQITDARFLPSGGSQALAAHGSSGRLVSAAVETSGRILIGAFGGTGGIAVGDVFRMGGVYLAE